MIDQPQQDAQQPGVWNKSVTQSLREIVIIFISVSLTALAFDCRDRRNAVESEKSFLIGLRRDLKNDINELKSDRQGYVFIAQAYNAFLNGLEQTPKDSIRFYTNFFVSYILPFDNRGLYEGFKASGKLGGLADHALRDDILDFYEEQLPLIKFNTTTFYQLNQPLSEWVLNHVTLSAIDVAVLKPLSQHIYLKNKLQTQLSYSTQIVLLYDNAIRLAESIVVRIEQIYPNDMPIQP